MREWRGGLVWLALLLSASLRAAGAVPSADTIGGHSLALRTDGTVFAWGSDSAGQLGLGTQIQVVTPSLINGLTDIRSASAGCLHAVALRNDGTVLTWGDNSYGQLGDGSLDARSVPGVVPGITNAIAISAGCYHTVVLRSDGSVWGWGANSAGALGDGTLATLRPSPVRSQISGVVSIAAGVQFTMALKADGTVWTWGSNFYGQLGDGTRAGTAGRAVPAVVPGVAGITSIEIGGQNAYAVTAGGQVMSWGDAAYNSLASGSLNPRATPAPIANLGGVRSVSASSYHALALKTDGTVAGWGRNEFGELGLGTFSVSAATPVQIPGVTGATHVAASNGHSVIVRSDGTAVAFGSNRFGQLGDGNIGVLSPSPVRVGFTGAVAGASAGGTYDTVSEIRIGFTLLWTPDGRLYSWGSNASGALGTGAIFRRSVPEIVTALPGAVSVSSGASHSAAVLSDGRVFSWGSNGRYQLGDGSAIDRSTPLPVAGLTGAVAVSAYFNHTMVLMADGTARVFGQTSCGNVADGYVRTPIAVLTLTGQALGDIVAISRGHMLRRDGTVWVCGPSIPDGRVSPTATTRATKIESLLDVVAISSNGGVTTVLKGNGSVFTWGGAFTNAANFNDAIGRRLVPVPLTGVTNIVGVGGNCVLRSDGTVWTWTYDAVSPVVARPLPGFSGVRTIGNCGTSITTVATAIRTDGSVLAQGYNFTGQLGDGTYATRTYPILVRREGGAGTLEQGDWFLDLDPGTAAVLNGENIPAFLVTSTGEGTDLKARIQFRGEDVGRAGSVYVFALAPANMVSAASGDEAPIAMGKATSPTGAKADVQCVLAQLSASGQLQAVSASTLQAYVTGVLSSQGQSVAVVNNAVNIAGATFYVGYGSSATTMLGTGLNRSVTTFTGEVECRPERPQTGWWWYPQQDGRGYSIEVQGDLVFFAAFLYDESGRSKWHVATGRTSLDGSLYTGDLYEVRNGQTLGGAYKAPVVTPIGAITLAFNTATTGTMVWPGGTVPLQRFAIVPNGLAAAPQSGVPESGWWWNPAESGRGFFIEWQNGSLDIAGYMYDDAGNPVWYLTVQTTPDPQRLVGTWWSYANGQTLLGAWKPNTRINDNVAPVTITFTSTTTATMTLPNGRTTSLQRHRF